MHVADINYLIIAIILFFVSFVVNPQFLFQYLLTAELLWVTLYALTLRFSFFTDDSNLYGLTLYILVFSAIEMAVGLVLITYYAILSNSTNVIKPLNNVSNLSLNNVFSVNNSKFTWIVKC